MACMLWWSTEEEDLEVVTMLLMYEFDQTDQKYLHFHKTQNMKRVRLMIEFHKGLSMMREQLMMECGATLVIRPSTSAPEDLRMSNPNMLTCCFMRNCQLNKLAILLANCLCPVFKMLFPKQPQVVLYSNFR